MWGRKRSRESMARLSAAAVNASETGAVVVASVDAGVDFFFGGFVGPALIDAVKDLRIGEAGIFHTGDFAGRNGGLILQTALQHGLHGGIGEADEMVSDRVSADGVEFVGP